MTGYVAGGTQLGETRERCSSSCRAVGRAELDSLQHACTSNQRVSEKPKDPAWGGFCGRSPRRIARKNVKPCILWNGCRPVRTWMGKWWTVAMDEINILRKSPSRGHNCRTGAKDDHRNGSPLDPITPDSSNDMFPRRVQQFRKRKHSNQPWS